MSAEIEIPYILNGTKKNYTDYIDIPENATASGTCGANLQSITLQWNNTLNATNKVSFLFVKRNVNSTKFDLSSIDVTIILDNGTVPGYNGKK